MKLVIVLAGASCLAFGQPAVPTVPPALVQAGETLFVQNCAFCHGRDTGGGESGPDLTRSQIVTSDVNGNQIGPVVRNGRNGMPRFTVTDQEVTALAAFIRVQKSFAEQNGKRRGVEAADLKTGNIDKGKEYFNGTGRCNTCHSPIGDLAGLAKQQDVVRLFQRLMYPSGAKATMIVTLPSGETVQGTREYVDEFTVALRDAAGRYRSFPAAKVKVQVDDPAEAHADLLGKYSDDDIHNLVTYLLTL